MPEIGSQQSPTTVDQPAGRGASAGTYLLRGFFLTIFLTIVRKLLEPWLPVYLPFGISAFLTGLLAYPFFPRVRHQRQFLAKWLLVVVVISSGITLVDYFLSVVLKVK